jgi:putative glycosyltransferase
MIGLEHSTGDFIFMFDSDLEEDPALLDTFYQLMTDSDESIDVVYGVMDSRKGKLFERASGALFYKLINLMSDTPIPSNIMAARLMTRAYVDNLVRYQEAHVYLGGVMSLAGFKQVGFRSDKGSKGVTTYSLPRKVQLALDALISYTNKPLTFIASFGLTISGLAFMVVLYLIGRALYTDVPVEGWHMVLGSIWLLGGLTISAIGLVGFYVGRIFVQVKQRPNAIVKKVHERK